MSTVKAQATKVIVVSIICYFIGVYHMQCKRKSRNSEVSVESLTQKDALHVVQLNTSRIKVNCR